MLTYYIFSFIGDAMQCCAVFQVQELGKQRLPDEGKQQFEDEEEIYDSYSTRVLNEFAAVTLSQKELSGSTASKFDANQVVSSDTTEQSTLSATTATSNIVQGSALNISAITPATKERSFVAITKQNMTANQETKCIVTTALSTSSVTASKQIIGIATAATKKSDSVVTATTAAAVANFENENNFTVTAASKTFMDSTEDAKIITNFLEPKSEVKTDSLKDNSNANKRTVTQTTKAHYEVKNSTAASISEKTDSKSHDHRHMDLRKIRSQSCVSDTESEILCGNESEFHMSLINTDIEYNLEVSLLTVLKKEVGESASLILTPHVIGCFKKELNCVVHELMMKAISSVVDNITEHCNQDENVLCESATEVTKISNMAQKWKKELMLIADKQRAEKENEMATLLDRAHKYRKRMSVLCLSDKVSQSNCEESNGNSCIINNGDKNESYVNDSINFVPDGYGDGTTEKSSLVGIVQDFLLLQNTTDSHMVGTQKCVSDQETQTISTGSVLYLKHLPDL
ncbi:hypothetical protein L798_14761 [Zootermopsis nevadensis]|uniref:Uncharacterized protein n=1 Tax=Zootermopsis nevadensis TaxID=136037 RepID=A0A067RQJ9_ZOONE|nr:hypothetical protein L798_14761 [Zootermopsis nevadensis]